MKGKCLWCGCDKKWHRGFTPQNIKNRFPPSTKWLKSSCANPACKGCRKYEH